MNIFVTGATGFLGRNFLPELLSAIGDEDRVFLLLRRDIDIDDARVKKLFGALETVEKFSREIAGCEYIFHLAANPAYGSKADYDSVNYVPTAKMVDIAGNGNRLKNFIFTSTIGALDRAPGDDCLKRPEPAHDDR